MSGRAAVFRASQLPICTSRFEMSFLRTGVAVVTGAGSGIGRALAQQLAAARSALALADIDEAGLSQTARSLEKKGALITAHILDVADEKAVCSFAKDVRRKHGRATRTSPSRPAMR